MRRHQILLRPAIIVSLHVRLALPKICWRQNRVWCPTVEFWCVRLVVRYCWWGTNFVHQTPFRTFEQCYDLGHGALRRPSFALKRQEGGFQRAMIAL